MRRAGLHAFVVLAASLGATSCGDHVSSVVVDSVDTGRNAQNQVTIQVGVVAAEQAGSRLGHYCVSFHVFGGDATLTLPAPSYYGAYETQEQCDDAGLDDGDRRTFVFTTTRTDIPPGLNLRAQSLVGHTFQKKDVNTP